MSKKHAQEEKEPEVLEETGIEEEVEEELEKTEVNVLEEAIKTLEETMKKQEEDYLRLSAEYTNYRNRTTKEKMDIYPEATANIVGRFLPVLDNFERAMEFEHETKEFAEGFDLIHQSFQEILNSLGVEPFGERGDAFDPELHNAVMHCEEEELPEKSVAQVLQKGYKIGDKVVRHAMVQAAN